MIYVDTSVLVAALTAEADTGRMQDWLAGQAAGDLSISDWTMTEFSSALSIKLRTGQLALDHRNGVLAAFNRMVAQSFEVLVVAPLHFRTAARLADRHLPGLRAGDALHLAIAIAHGARMVTLDRRLAEAGSAAGADIHLI